MGRWYRAAASLALLAPAAAQICDQEYECTYRTPDIFAAYYDLKPLCTTKTPAYVFTNTTTNSTFKFNICGSAGVDCVPGYDVEYQRGTAVQFFGDVPPVGQMCRNKAGNMVQCTQDCEILGVGVPIITLIDSNRPFSGVNVDHVGVPPVGSDNFLCDRDPVTNEMQPRTVTIQVQCNASASLNPHIIAAYEVTRCKYLIVVQSSYGCGCEPFCYNRNCGEDGCGGFCGPQGHAGNCPDPQTCSDSGVCCRPDCRNRQCGGDGCGGSCGTCGAGFNCTRYQQCVASSGVFAPSPMPSLLPASTIYTTTPGDKFAAYVGGTLSAGVIAIGIMFYMRARAART